MAHPTRKHTRARRGKRRAHWNLTPATTTQCTQCAQRIRTHRVCPHCGYYRGKAVIAIKVKQEAAGAKK